MTSQPHIQGRRETQGEENKKIQANTLKKTKIYQYLLDQGLVKKRGSQIDQFVTTFFVKKMPFGVQRKAAPQIAKLKHQGSHGFDKCMMFIHILCIGFCS